MKMYLSIISVVLIVFCFHSCEKETDSLETFQEKSDYIRTLVDNFNSENQSSGFFNAIERILDELSENKSIVSSGVSVDSSIIWWQTQDNSLFFLQLKKFDDYNETLANENALLNTRKFEAKGKATDNLPHNKKALLLSPSYYDWAYTVPFSSEEKKDINYYFKQKLEAQGFEVEYYKNEQSNQYDITIENYQNWYDYGVISFSGHGFMGGNYNVIKSGIRLTNAFVMDHFDDFANKVYTWFGDVDYPDQLTVGITNKFFKKYYPDGLEDTFVLMSACMQARLGIELIDPASNSSVLWGWNTPMTPLEGAWRSTRILIDMMLDNGKTAKEALDYLVQNDYLEHRYEILSNEMAQLIMWFNSNSDFRLTDLKSDYYLDDDFETYNVGSFPSEANWEIKYTGAGNQYQYISQEYSLSGTQSFRLQGALSWSARIVNQLPEQPDIVYFEAAFYSESVEHEGSFGLRNPNVGTWGTGISACSFHDGYINVNGYDLSQYMPHQWHKVKVFTNLTDQTFSAWLDDEIILENHTFDYPDVAYTHFYLDATNDGSNIVFYDNVKVWKK